MLVCDYIVERIDGDYAHLRRTDELEEELKVVARDLLPPEIIEGSMLHYEWMQYTLILGENYDSSTVKIRPDDCGLQFHQ